MIPSRHMLSSFFLFPPYLPVEASLLVKFQFRPLSAALSFPCNRLVRLCLFWYHVGSETLCPAIRTIVRSQVFPRPESTHFPCVQRAFSFLLRAFLAFARTTSRTLPRFAPPEVFFFSHRVFPLFPFFVEEDSSRKAECFTRTILQLRQSGVRSGCRCHSGSFFPPSISHSLIFFLVLRISMLFSRRGSFFSLPYNPC